MWIYNQYLSPETKQWCSIVSLLQVMLYRYGIKVKHNFIITLAIFFDSIWKFSISEWARFPIIDTAFVWYLNLKTKLKFKLETNTIPNLDKDDHRTYQLWVTNYSTYRFKKAIKMWNGRITKEWIDYLVSSNWAWGHAMNLDLSAWGYLVDTNTSDNPKITLAVLKYWHKKGLFFTNIRTISPANKETEEVTNLTIKMFQAEKKGRLNLLYNKESENPYLSKAKFLYWYWR